MRALKFAEDWLEAFNRRLLFLLAWIAIVLIAVMTSIILVAVFFRYVLGDALIWTEEVAKFMMVWMTFVAAPIAYREGSLVAVGIIAARFSGRLYPLLAILIQLVVISIMIVFLKEGSFLTWNSRIQTASTIDWFSIVWVYISMPIGAFALLTVSLGLLLRAVQELIHPTPPGAAGPRPLDIPGAM
ncbi:MAG: TRAP transporter small permease [Thiotrichales bacterium]|nr:TRAP transporter small permease [Thiotrichales bacterium]